jgi:ribokinase
MDVTAIGGYGLGVALFVDRAPTAGETVAGASLVTTPGGKGSNQAVAAARLGARTALISAIGPDANGRQGQRLWETEGVDQAGVVTLDGPTMVGVIVTDQTGENRIIVADGVLGDLEAAHVERGLRGVDQPRIVLVSCEIAAAGVAAALAAGRAAGATTILNPAPAPRLTPADWDNTDIVTPNQSEARALLGGPGAVAADPATIARELATRHDVTVIMTLGAEGVLVCPRPDAANHPATGKHALPPAGAAVRIPAFPTTEIRDTTGAGDAFNGALAAGLAAGLGLVEAAHVGAICGALTVRRRGVIPALPTLAAATDALQAHGLPQLAAALSRSQPPPNQPTAKDHHER